MLLREFVASGLAGKAWPVEPVAPPKGADNARVMPMIRSAAHLPAGETMARLATVPFAGGLYQCWTVDRPAGEQRCIEGRQLRAAGGGKEEMLALALANLRTRAGAAEDRAEGRVHRLALGDTYGSSLMLLPEFWADRAAQGPLTAAIPVEGELYWIAGASPAELDSLRQLARSRHEAARRGEVVVPSKTSGLFPATKLQPISPELFRWTGTGWQVIAE